MDKGINYKCSQAASIIQLPRCSRALSGWCRWNIGKRKYHLLNYGD